MSQLTIVDTELLRITLEAGVTGTAVVSFAGTGFGFGSLQKREFANSIRGRGANHAIISVIDKTRSWYNRVRDQVPRLLNPILGDFDSAVTLGNSMGGFGALYYGSLLTRCRRAIAFAPQFSVTPETPEHRWQEWRRGISEWSIDNALVALSPKVPSIIVFGDPSSDDKWHLARMRERIAPPHTMFVIQGGGHDVAATLKTAGALAAFVGHAIEGASPADLGEVLRRADLPSI